MKLKELSKLKVCWEVPYHETWERTSQLKNTIHECGMTDEIKQRPQSQRLKASFLYITSEKKPKVGILTIKLKKTPQERRHLPGVRFYTPYLSDDTLEDIGITSSRLQSCIWKNPKEYSHDLCDYLVEELKKRVEIL